MISFERFLPLAPTSARWGLWCLGALSALHSPVGAQSAVVAGEALTLQAEHALSQTSQDQPSVLAQMELKLEQLRVQKAQIQENFDQKTAACLKKFAVTGCKLDVLNEKNELMAVVKRQEAQIHQEQKRLRSEQKLKDLSQRQSAEEIERSQERARVAQEAYDARAGAHAQRLSEHERHLNAEGVPRPATPEQKAHERQTTAPIAQDLYEEKVRAAQEHRQEARKRQESRTVHPEPLPLPSVVSVPMETQKRSLAESTSGAAVGSHAAPRQSQSSSTSPVQGPGPGPGSNPSPSPSPSP